MATIKRISLKHKLFIILSLCIAITISITGLYHLMNEQHTQKITSMVRELYQDDKPKQDIALSAINQVKEEVTTLRDDHIKNDLLAKLDTAYAYAILRDELHHCFNNSILKSSVTDQMIIDIQKKYSELPENIQIMLHATIESATKQKAAMNKALKALYSLFEDTTKLENVKINTERQDLDYVLDLFQKLPQKDLSKKYELQFHLVSDSIQEREDKEEKRRMEEEKRYIRQNSTTIIQGVPMINQNSEGVLQGCEAASLLMGLQSKGIALTMNLKQFASFLPKSDSDPHVGFIYDLYSNEPHNVPHWIAPDALAAFGAAYYDGVYDISGSSPEQLREQLYDGNPVIVYATGYFQNPTSWIGDAPVNLHVSLLIGYDAQQQTYIMQDPGLGLIRIDKDIFEAVYNTMRYAVVID